MTNARARWVETFGLGNADGIGVIAHFPLELNGSIRKSVDSFLDPVKIILPLYHTLHSSLSNQTPYLALHKGQKQKSEAMAILGTMCHTRGRGHGSPGTTMLHMCVDQTWRPSGRLTVSGFAAGCLLSTDTPSLCWIPQRQVHT